MRLSKYLWLFLLFAYPAKASDYFVAAASAGSGNGSSCANADIITGTHFTTGANWVQDLTWHLCGAFTGSAGATLITTLGSGAVGHPITIKFESGATAKAPYWSANGAIRVNHNFIVITGTNACGHTADTTNVECTEFIQNTLNGISGLNICPGGVCTNQQNSTGIYLNGCTGCEVKNLGVFDLYDRVANSTTDLNQMGLTVDVVGGSSIHVHNLHTTNSANGPAFAGVAGTTTSGIEFDHIWAQGHHVGLQVGDGGANVIMNGVLIHDNDISGGSIWDANNGSTHLHNEGIHLFTNFSGSQLNSPMVYNNYYHGANGAFFTAFTFFEFVTTPYVFNNVFVIEGGNAPTNATHGFKAGSGGHSFNNTMVSSNGGTGVIIQNSSTNVTAENNLTSCVTPACTYTNTDPNETGQVWDYNLYWQSIGTHFFYNNAFYSWNVPSSWQGTLGFDAHGQAGNDPKLSASFVPLAGSAAIAHGLNLTSVCSGQPNPGLGALCFDKAGNVRPSTSPWDQGAYQSLVVVPAPAVQLSRTLINFGPQNTGTSSANVNTVVTNTGTANLTVSSVTVTGADAANYSINTNTCTVTITPSATCSFNTTFTPGGVGTFNNAFATVASNAATTSDKVTLNGTGQAPITVSISVTPSPIVFGNQIQGVASAPVTVTVKSIGTGSFTFGTPYAQIVAGGSNPVPADFGLAAPGGTPCSNALVMAPSVTCTFTVTAILSQLALETAQLNVNGPPNASVNISGTGLSSQTAPTPAPAIFVNYPFQRVMDITVTNCSNPCKVRVTCVSGCSSNVGMTAGLN